MKIFATILNVLMLCAIIVISIKEGFPGGSKQLLIVAVAVFFNLINILAINKKTSKSIETAKEKLSTKLKTPKKLGVILIFIGLLLPSATYPLTTVDDDTHNIQLYSAMKGREYLPSFRELRLEYSTYNYIMYKNILFIGILSIFAGSGLVTKEIFMAVSRSKEKMPNK